MFTTQSKAWYFDSCFWVPVEFSEFELVRCTVIREFASLLRRQLVHKDESVFIGLPPNQALAITSLPDFLAQVDALSDAYSNAASAVGVLGYNPLEGKGSNVSPALLGIRTVGDQLRSVWESVVEETWNAGEQLASAPWNGTPAAPFDSQGGGHVNVAQLTLGLSVHPGDTLPAVDIATLSGLIRDFYVVGAWALNSALRELQENAVGMPPYVQCAYGCNWAGGVQAGILAMEDVTANPQWAGWADQDKCRPLRVLFKGNLVKPCLSGTGEFLEPLSFTNKSKFFDWTEDVGLDLPNSSEDNPLGSLKLADLYQAAMIDGCQ